MGFYIDPPDQSKEDWLEKNGRKISVEINRSEMDVAPNEMPVCLVSNIYFTAAGICYDQAEFWAFSDPSDRRHKIWYAVPTKLLLQFYPNLPHGRV